MLAPGFLFDSHVPVEFLDDALEPVLVVGPRVDDWDREAARLHHDAFAMLEHLHPVAVENSPPVCPG